MSLRSVSRLISNCLNPTAVPSLYNFGFSTLMGNSTRSYIRNFWNRKTAIPVPGHMHKNKRFDGNNKGLRVSIFRKSQRRTPPLEYFKEN